MTNIAWRNLARERLRLAISVGGVAFAVLLILVLRGLYAGVLDQATQYIRSVDADIWVAEREAPGDFFHSVSLLSTDLRDDVGAVAGVQDVNTLVARPIVFEHGGKDLDFLLLGIDPVGVVGGPPAIEKGRTLRSSGELVLDRVFSRNAGIGIGDTVTIEDRRLRVVGLARGGNTLFSQFAWASDEDVRRLFGIDNLVNYYLVGVADSTDARAVADRLERDVEGVQAFDQAEFLDANTSDISEGFLPIIWVLVVIAFVIGTAVIGLTIYTATLEKRREYGVLKAIGFTNRRLFGIIYQQSLVAGAIGFAVGLFLAVALGAFVERMVPSFVLLIRPTDVALVAVVAVVMTIVSSFLPARPVARLDPAQVFRV
ncbi:MAG: FtsX-like permease family protein [Actinomycetota bacterium]|nr:FtsX-like permease family protein [Actinomycetota bacterium]